MVEPFYVYFAQADLLLPVTHHHPRLPGVGTFYLLLFLYCPPGLQYQRDKGAANAAVVGSGHDCEALVSFSQSFATPTQGPAGVKQAANMCLGPNVGYILP